MHAHPVNMRTLQKGVLEAVKTCSCAVACMHGTQLVCCFAEAGPHLGAEYQAWQNALGCHQGRSREDIWGRGALGRRPGVSE